MIAKTTTLRTLYVHVVLNDVSFRQILHHIVAHARHFLPVKFLTSKYYFNELWFQLPLHLLNEHGDLIFIVFFETVLGREHSG